MQRNYGGHACRHHVATSGDDMSTRRYCEAAVMTNHIARFMGIGMQNRNDAATGPHWTPHLVLIAASMCGTL